MAHILDLMEIKQILRLHSNGLSNRRISETLGIHRNTINTYVKLFRSSKLISEAVFAMDNHELSKLFAGHTTIDNPRYDELMKFFDGMRADREHRGFTLLYHYNEYKTVAKSPYSYTQFMEHYNRKYTQGKGSMKLLHKPGHELFIDFAGKKHPMVDKDTGQVRQLELFVAILPCSQRIYVEACPDQSIESLIRCVASALKYFGGVPRAIVCDNLKSAITKASKYEPRINRSFLDFANHY